MNPKNLRTRTISALILGTIALYAVYQGGLAFDLLVVLMSGLMAFEWSNLTKKASKNWKLFGIIYIALPCLSLLYIRTQPQGEQITAWLFVTIWIADTAAFFAGTFIGGPKLAPSISPNKTWAGLIGALIAASVWGEFSINFIIFTAVIAFSALCGDLFESWIKRKFNVKDSGNCIPGHGGILDRVDSLTLAAPLLALALNFYQ